METEKALVTPTPSLSQVLRKAASIMEEKGWNNGDRHALDGTVCVLGALESARVEGSRNWASERTEPLIGILVERLSLPPYSSYPHSKAWSLAGWSNSSSGKVVCEGLRKVARMLEAEDEKIPHTP